MAFSSGGVGNAHRSHGFKSAENGIFYFFFEGFNAQYVQPQGSKIDYCQGQVERDMDVRYKGEPAALRKKNLEWERKAGACGRATGQEIFSCSRPWTFACVSSKEISLQLRSIG